MNNGIGIKKHFFIGVITIFIISFFVRAMFLGAVGQVIFDEVHFGKFVSSYCCTGERFFDIHPPIGKLIIAGGSYVAGYRGGFSFESIGQQYGEISIIAIRFMPALAGVLLPLIVFILLQQVGVSYSFSFLGGIAVALDNAFIVESRIIITDSILLSATFGAIACAFASIRSKSEWYSWGFSILAGVFSGVAVGTKFTGLIAGGVVLVMFILEAFNPSFVRRKKLLLKIMLVSLVAILVYTLGWILHFSLLTMPGSGDAWGIPTGNFWTDVVTTHKQMVSANYNLTADHPYGSKWFTWPFMARSVFYWQGSNGNQFIYLLGNPVVWWGSFFLFCFGIVSLFLKIASGAKSSLREVFSSGAWVFLLGYFVSFVPLMRVPRVLFLYHYLTPLLFSLLFGIWLLDWVIKKGKVRQLFLGLSFFSLVVPVPGWWYQMTPVWMLSLTFDSSFPAFLLWRFVLFACFFLILSLLAILPSFRKIFFTQPAIVLFVGVVIVLGFIVISPITYGIPLSDSWYNLLFSTFSSWR
ncbi:MAG: phospholipid carrier-dependent glycosyltransferase [bacterium]|nr:phospholipid carrier-dependent glycosyltransferase [bacterium]